MLYESPKIFVDKRVFDENWVPPELPVRRKEAQRLVNILLSRIEEGGRGLSNPIMILGVKGAVGIGKTTLAKYVAAKTVDLAREKGFNVKSVYVNVYGNTGAHSILKVIITELGLNIATSGFPVQDMFKAVIDRLFMENMFLIIILDEFQRMALSRTINPADLYLLIRYYEVLPMPDKVPRIGYILVASNMADLSAMKERMPQIESQIGLKIRLDRYRAEDIYEILKQRAEMGLHPNAWNDEILWTIAERTGAPRFSGSARKAIKALYTAAELAESEGLSYIDSRHIREALSHMNEYGISLSDLEGLHIQELLLLKALIRAGLQGYEWIKSGDLKKMYDETAELHGVKPLAYTQFNQHLKNLVTNLDLVEARSSGKGVKGRTTFYRIASFIELDSFEEIVDDIIMRKLQPLPGSSGGQRGGK